MGKRPDQPAADHPTHQGSHKAGFPLHYFHSWISVVRRIVGLNIVVVHHDSAAVLKYEKSIPVSLRCWLDGRLQPGVLGVPVNLLGGPQRTHRTCRCVAVTMMYFRQPEPFRQNSNTRLDLRPKEIEGDARRICSCFQRKEEHGVEVKEMAPMGLLAVESIGSSHGNAGFAPDAGRR